MTETVLAYIEKDDSYLMLYRNKEENDMNEGFYMGVGGHIENQRRDFFKGSLLSKERHVIF